MNAQSFVAVEYIHILNKEIYSSDCMNMNVPVANDKPSLEQGNVQPTKPIGQQAPQQIEPKQGPQGAQGQIQPTKPSGHQGPPQQGYPPLPVPIPPHANNNANNIYLHETLVAILVLSALSVASIILIGLYYCFVGSRQKGTKHCTK